LTAIKRVDPQDGACACGGYPAASLAMRLGARSLRIGASTAGASAFSLQQPNFRRIPLRRQVRIR
jgi:hypothetical protein